MLEASAVLSDAEDLETPWRASGVESAFRGQRSLMSVEDGHSNNMQTGQDQGEHRQAVFPLSIY